LDFRNNDSKLEKIQIFFHDIQDFLNVGQVEKINFLESQFRKDQRIIKKLFLVFSVIQISIDANNKKIFFETCYSDHKSAKCAAVSSVTLSSHGALMGLMKITLQNRHSTQDKKQRIIKVCFNKTDYFSSNFKF
jgi:hypothetical protein